MSLDNLPELSQITYYLAFTFDFLAHINIEEFVD